jgi:hypothetical protein
MVMFATIFFKAVFFLTNPLSLLSPLCLSSSRSSWAFPLASLSVYHSKKGRSGRTEQLGVGHCEYRSTSTCCLCSCCADPGLRSCELASEVLEIYILSYKLQVVRWGSKSTLADGVEYTVPCTSTRKVGSVICFRQSSSPLLGLGISDARCSNQYTLIVIHISNNDEPSTISYPFFKPIRFHNPSDHFNSSNSVCQLNGPII